MKREKRNGASEIARMSEGRLYNCTSGKVFAKHFITLCRVDKFNRTHYWNVLKQRCLIKKIIPNHGENFMFMQTFRCEYGFNITFGKNLFVNFDCIFMDVAQIKIGDDVMFGPRVVIATPMHSLVAEERIVGQYPDGYHNLEYAKPVTIGNRVWIAANVTICGGVTIGDGAVIGAGSVVTRDVPPNSLAVGVPARVIRKIDDDDKLNVFEAYKTDDTPLSPRAKSRQKLKKHATETI